jgi:hypothetical protein
MAKKQDNRKWWIIGIIVAFLVMTSSSGDDKKTGFGCSRSPTPAQTCAWVSNEPTTLSEYESRMLNMEVGGVALNWSEMDSPDTLFISNRDLKTPRNFMGYFIGGLEQLGACDLDYLVVELHNESRYENYVRRSSRGVDAICAYNYLDYHTTCGLCAKNSDYWVSILHGSDYDSNTLIDAYTSMFYDQVCT